MITRNHRFHGRGSLNRAYQHGRTVRLPELGLRYLLHDRRRTYRVAIVVSKSVSKSAVTRNRIRRRLYEAVRQQSVDISGAYDLVITVYKHQIDVLSAQELNTAVKRLFGQAAITKKPTKAETEPHAIIEAKEH